MSQVTLEELSKHLGYSCVYTGKLIKTSFGKNYSDYIQDLRCLKAAKLLVETDYSINQIINFVGYENGSFFRKVFKKRFGLNPLEYRKKGI